MGEAVGEALPSTAVSVIGLDAVPAAGDVFTVFENEADAHNAAEVCTICCSVFAAAVVDFFLL